MNDYDPWKGAKRCDEQSPGKIHCQLPKGHTCDHVWFGDAGKHSSDSDWGRSYRWPVGEAE